MAQIHLNILRIPVSNVEASLAFYRDQLGFEVLVHVEEYGWAQLQRDNLPLALYVPGMGGGDRPPGGSCDFLLNTDDIVELWTELDENGAPLGEGILSGDDTTAFIELEDPDGNVIKIIQTLKKEH